MNGKILIKKPEICDCVINIDGTVNRIKNKEIEISYGTLKINVAIAIDTMMDTERSRSNEEFVWAWENDKEVNIDSTYIEIIIKRKWHLFTHITTDAYIQKADK